MFVKNKPTLSTCITKLFVTTKEERTKSDKMATNSHRFFHVVLLLVFLPLSGNIPCVQQTRN